MAGGNRGTLNIVAFVTFAYSIPTYLLYILILYVILVDKNKINFSTSFYKLFCLSAVINFIFHITSYFFFRATEIPFLIPVFKSLPENGFFMTLIPVIAYHTGVASAFVDFFISLNRFTVILLKEKFKEFWRKMMPWVYAIVLIVPNLCTWHLWLTDVRNKPYNESDIEQGYYWDENAKDNVPWMQNSRNMSIVIFGCVFPACFMNFYVCFHLIKRKLSKNSLPAIYDEKQNIQLLIFTFLIFLNEICLGFVMMSFTLSTDQVFLVNIYYYMGYMFDVVALTPAWFLFIVDGMLRNSIFKICASEEISAASIPSGIATSSVQVNEHAVNNRDLELSAVG